MIQINYRKLDFYITAHSLVIEIYKTSQMFPKEEKFGLISQIRRSSSSILFNIAEGSGRSSKKDFKNFLHISLGSAKETEVQLLITKDLGYISEGDYLRLNSKISKIIGQLTNYIKKI